VDERAEWQALVDDALSIRESAEDKRRRLHQLQRDIARAELAPIDQSELLSRLQAVDGNA